jgi:hypothetical protein
MRASMAAYRGARAQRSGTAAEHLDAHARAGRAASVAFRKHTTQRLPDESLPAAIGNLRYASLRAASAPRGG